MRLAIHHETAYRYTAPAHYSIQQLRLTPRPEAHQRVLSWRIDAPGKLQRFVDAYGNVAHTLVITAPHDAIRVVVAGSVEIEARPADPGAQDLSPLVFAVATPLTEAEGAVRDFAALHLKRTGRAQDFLALAEGICGAVAYETGITEVTSTAANALEIGRGVCQDHAHLFIACCRSMNVPAPRPRRAGREPCLGRRVDRGRRLGERGRHAPRARARAPLPARDRARLSLRGAGPRRAHRRRRGVAACRSVGALEPVTPACHRMELL